MSSQPPFRQRHLIIAGTGRAGTTFLVRYFTALGLDTHLSRRGAAAWLDEEAQAGLEDFPLGPDAGDLPYLIKNPMLYEFIDQLIASDSIAIDGVMIIPVRSLREATSSRVILERRAMTEHQPWQTFMDRAWETSGTTAGGLIASLTALDEARVLAMGFHLLVERLVRANVPMVFMDFPRIISDGDYLYDKVEPFLPVTATREIARDHHARLADPEKVRIERETAASPANESTLDGDLDRIALLREIKRLRTALQAPPTVPAVPEEVARAAEERLAITEERKAIAEERHTIAEEQQAIAEERQAIVEDRNAIVEIVTAEASRLRTIIDDLERLRARGSAEIERLRAHISVLEAELAEARRRNAVLAGDLSLAVDRLNIVVEERNALDAQCHRLEMVAAEGRNRVLAAEQTMHRYLAPFSDTLSALVPEAEGIAVLQIARERMGALIEQLEDANGEVAATAERLFAAEHAIAQTPQTRGGTIKRFLR